MKTLTERIDDQCDKLLDAEDWRMELRLRLNELERWQHSAPAEKIDDFAEAHSAVIWALREYDRKLVRLNREMNRLYRRRLVWEWLDAVVAGLRDGFRAWADRFRGLPAPALEQSFVRIRKTYEMRPYVPGETLPPGLVILDVDKAAGSPQEGDWISRDPDDHSDLRLVSARDFALYCHREDVA